MPIVHVTSLERDRERLDRATTAVVRDVSRATGIDRDDVWATHAPMTHLRLGDRSVDADAGDIVFAELVMRPRGDDVRTSALRAIASSLSASLDRPEADVWVRYTPVTAGTVYAGGDQIE